MEALPPRALLWTVTQLGLLGTSTLQHELGEEVRKTRKPRHSNALDTTLLL